MFLTGHCWCVVEPAWTDCRKALLEADLIELSDGVEGAAPAPLSAGLGRTMTCPIGSSDCGVFLAAATSLRGGEFGLITGKLLVAAEGIQAPDAGAVVVERAAGLLDLSM